MKKTMRIRLTLGCLLLSSIAFISLLLCFLQIHKKTERILSESEAALLFLQEEHPSAQLFSCADEKKVEITQDRPDALHTYHSPEGIVFSSNAGAWDENMLEALYQELLQNEHGEELYSLTDVIIYPDADPSAAATHQNRQENYSLSITHPAFPENFNLSFSMTTGVITLYDGDNCTTVASMAESLSHEYGHHYTMYYMFQNMSAKSQLESEYSRLRNFPQDKIQTDLIDKQYYISNHHWYLVEIAAEDYVSLMGSPLSREITDYDDIHDSLYYDVSAKKVTKNAMVQENLMLPMASDVPGLAEYFYSFLGKPAPEFSEKRDISPAIREKTATYDLIGGKQTFVHYTITWEKAYGEDAVYTLVSFDPEDYLNTFDPIKTIYPSEQAIGYIGTVTRNMGNKIIYNNDGYAVGTRTFVVTAVTPDGQLYCSAPVEYSFP